MSVAVASAEVFYAYLDQVLLPALRRTKPGTVLVMDNLAAPQGAIGARSWTAPASPTATCHPTRRTSIPSSRSGPPIWVKVKTELRRVAARTADALHKALRPALASITAEDASECFQHCGYARPN